MDQIDKVLNACNFYDVAAFCYLVQYQELGPLVVAADDNHQELVPLLLVEDDMLLLEDRLFDLKNLFDFAATFCSCFTAFGILDKSFCSLVSFWLGDVSVILFVFLLVSYLKIFV